MEWLTPAVELVKTGSPYLAGAMLGFAIGMIIKREQERHYNTEAANAKAAYEQSLKQWERAHVELQERCKSAETKRDDYLLLLMVKHQEFAEFIRDVSTAAQKAGTS